MRTTAENLPAIIRPVLRPTHHVNHLMAILVVLIIFPCCSDRYGNVANLDSPETIIVFFGNSITAGYGVEPGQAFPALIADRLEVPVVNAGVSGDTTADALARLEKDVVPQRPRLVVVEFGGNDFRRRMDKEQTFRNLDRIVERITEIGAMVIVMEIRIGLLRDEYLAGYEEVSNTHGAVLIPDFMSGIFGNHKLTVDGLHPTPEGHELIAQRIIERLVPLLEEADRVRAGKQ